MACRNAATEAVGWKNLRLVPAYIRLGLCPLFVNIADMAASIASSISLPSSASTCFRAGKAHAQPIGRPLTVSPAAVHRVMSGASQSYPQKVRLDEGKAKVAELQSEQSKAQGGETKPSDASSKAKVGPLIVAKTLLAAHVTAFVESQRGWLYSPARASQ